MTDLKSLIKYLINPTITGLIYGMLEQQMGSKYMFSFSSNFIEGSISSLAGDIER